MPSTGSVGDAYDNAMAEGCFTTLEKELRGMVANRISLKPMRYGDYYGDYKRQLRDQRAAEIA